MGKKDNKKQDKDKRHKKDDDKKVESSNTQPPPPKLEGSDHTSLWDHGHHHHHHKQRSDDDDKHGHKHHGSHYHYEEMKAAEVIYQQVLEVRKVVEKLQKEALDAKLAKRYETVPVRVHDLMRGFQSAVAKANRANHAGESDGEEIDAMAIKDLEITLSAPIIEGGHAEDPVIMLPNIKSANSESAKIELKFNVVSVPSTQRR